MTFSHFAKFITTNPRRSSECGVFVYKVTSVYGRWREILGRCRNIFKLSGSFGYQDVIISYLKTILQDTCTLKTLSHLLSLLYLKKQQGNTSIPGSTCICKCKIIFHFAKCDSTTTAVDSFIMAVTAGPYSKDLKLY